MIGRMLTGSMLALAGGFVTGVAHSSYRHYYHRYADEQDLVQRGPMQEVVVVRDLTKKRRGSKS
jgi:hypothetical protein